MKVNIGKYPKDHTKKRKVSVKIEDHDIFNLDETLSHIILPALKKIKQSKQTAPFIDNEDVPEELRRTNGDKYDLDVNWFNRWDYVLNQMIWAFSENLRDWESDYYSGRSRFKSVPVDESGNEVDKKNAKYFELRHDKNSDFKVDHEGMEKHREKIANGLRLFAKYYSGLWT